MVYCKIQILNIQLNIIYDICSRLYTTMLHMAYIYVLYIVIYIRLLILTLAVKLEQK